MRTPAARAALVTLALVAAAGPADAERASPLPGSVGLTQRQVATPHACVPGGAFRQVKRVKGGDDPTFAKAMVMSPIRGLDFDPEKPARVKVSTKKFQAWIETMQKRFSAARKEQEKVVHDPAAAPEAKVAAVARIAILADQTVLLLDAIEVPPSVRKMREAKDAFCDRMDEVAEPLRTQAADARAYCAALIAKHTVAAGWWTEICVLPPAAPATQPSPAPSPSRLP